MTSTSLGRGDAGETDPRAIKSLASRMFTTGMLNGNERGSDGGDNIVQGG